MQYLRQSTAVTIRIGPFLNSTDGVSAETGLTISQADVRLSKAGGAAAQKNEATAATHDENGYYRVAIDTTDTNTVGRLDVCVSESGALPVWAHYTVLPAVVYDAIIGGTDYLQVHAREIDAGLITAAVIATGAIDADALATDAVTEITAANWSYTSRTLTVSSTGATSTTTADLMTERRGDSWSITVTGLPDNTGYTSIWFTVKHRPGDTDAASVIQVKKNASGTGDGLLYVNGAAASDATKGSITVNSTTSITVTLDESVTDDLIPGLYAYDIQTLIAGAVNTPSAGQFEVSADVTRSVA